MDRLKVLTEPSAYKDAYPEKAELVEECSIVEMIVLYLNIRDDFNYEAYLNKPAEVFHEKLSAWLGPVNIVGASDECCIYAGECNFVRDLTLEDSKCIQNLLSMKTEFQKTLFDAHTLGVKHFIMEASGKLCGNTLLHCSDDDFDKVMRSIDFKFTTVSNLLTALRADILLNTERFGRVRTTKDVYLIDLKASKDQCVYVNANKL